MPSRKKRDKARKTAEGEMRRIRESKPIVLHTNEGMDSNDSVGLFQQQKNPRADVGQPFPSWVTNSQNAGYHAATNAVQSNIQHVIDENARLKEELLALTTENVNLKELIARLRPKLQPKKRTRNDGNTTPEHGNN